MVEITRSVKVALKFCLHSFSTMLICRIALQNLSIQSHWRPFSATSVLRMRSSGYLWTFGENLHAAVRFYYPNFLPECKISAIWRHFPLIFAFCILNDLHISTFGFFDLLTWNVYHTRRFHVDNSHHVCSWYDHLLPSYSASVWWYVTWSSLLTCLPWTVDEHGGSRDQPCHEVWRTWTNPFLSYEL